MTKPPSKDAAPGELAKVTVLKGDSRATVAAPRERGEKQDREVHLVVMAGTPVGHVYTLNYGMNVIGRDDLAQIKLEDHGISRHHAMIYYDAPSDSFLIRDMESRNGTSVNGVEVKEPRALARGDKIEVGLKTVLRLSYGDEVETHFAKQMLHEALRDPLTGIYNRGKLEKSLEIVVPAARQKGAHLSLLLFDIDHFKRINDTFGHPAGDAVLRWLCEQISSVLRSEDLFIRYGGEEFVVLCSDLDEAAAAAQGERMREVIARHACVTESTTAADLMTTQEIDPATLAPATTKIPVTISLGVAGLAGADASAMSIVDAADQALYAAKHGGRNRVVRFSQLPR